MLSKTCGIITVHCQVWLSHDQNMNESSIWWGTVYGEMNKYKPVNQQGCIFANPPDTPLQHEQLLRTTICRTAIDQERPHMNKPGKHTSIPAVAWWQIGNEVSLCLYIHQRFCLLVCQN